AEVEQGARLPIDQGAVGVSRQPDRRALRLRVARRLRQLVPFLWRLELGIRRTRVHAPAHCQHQRPAYLREPAQIPLAVGTAAGRSPRVVRARVVATRREAEHALQITTGRPATLAPRGIVTSPHALASQAGVDVLRAGGSAVDA